MNNKLKILLISSISPYSSANLGFDIIKSLEEKGHQVDLITKFKEKNPSNRMFSIFNSTSPKSFIGEIKKKIPFLKKIHKPSATKISSNYYSIVIKDELTPPVNVSLLLDQINTEYDFVLVLFWKGLITTKSLEGIFLKLKVPIFLLPIDMLPLTGGCDYFWDCQKFMTGCGMCPGLQFQNELDCTSENFIVKKLIYNKIDCVFLGNSWMNSYASRSPLFSENQIGINYLVVNEKIYKPKDKNSIRNKLNISSDKKFLIFIGSVNNIQKRKGFSYLVESINSFCDSLSKIEQSEVLLLIAGIPLLGLSRKFSLDVKELGYLDYINLSDAYAVSDLYLSASIQDAGPSMVNQALMCGTPVVAFNVGVAIDLVISGKTGYCAQLLDSNDLTNGIKSIYNLTIKEKIDMSENCRSTALEASSYLAFSNNIEKTYNEYISHKVNNSKSKNDSL